MHSTKRSRPLKHAAARTFASFARWTSVATTGVGQPSFKRIARAAAMALAAGGFSVLGVADNSLDELSAGTFTIRRADKGAYFDPAPVLSERQLDAFQRGKAGFNRPWVVFSISTGDWGVGPTFIADRCSGCHTRGGRGEPPEDPDEELLSTLVRLSVPGTDFHGGPKPHPHYGDQLQNRSLQGQTLDLMPAYAPIPAEASVRLDWDETSVALADGTAVPLRRPRIRIANLAFGALGDDILTSLRNASPLIGLGLLEAVPEDALLAIADRQRTLGYNGRPNRVWDGINQRVAMGRFGWKANQPTLRQQIAAAAIGDMGVTSALFPKQNCPDVQDHCRREVPGNDPELSDAAWNDMEMWATGLAVPARRQWNDATVQRGAGLFEALECSVCHVPTLVTAEYFPRLPEASRQVIHPYTDLLLHDMGPDLADGRPDFEAGGQDWRTPPLWGLGLSKTVSGSTALLHDGRARNVTEAILWHGGEAQRSRDRFARLSKEDRDALAAFVGAL